MSLLWWIERQREREREQEEGREYVCVCCAQYAYRVHPGYKDIGVCDTSAIASNFLWYQLIPVNHKITLVGCKNTHF